MRKLLLTSQRFYPNKGGIENSLLHLAKAYKKKGYSVDVVVSDVNSVNREKLAQFEKLDNHIHLHRYRYRNVFFSILSLIHLLSMRKLDSYDLIISRSHITSLALLLMRCKRFFYIVPGIVSKQNSIERNGVQGFARLFSKISLIFHTMVQRSVLRRARILCFSEMMILDSIKEAAPVRINPLLIKMGVEQERFNFVNSVVHEGSSFRIVVVARLVHAKRVDLAIEALSFLPSIYRLDIVGDGPLLTPLKALSRLKGTDDRVRFYGSVDRPEYIMKECHAFCFTSTYEPFGQTLLESVALGLPVVAFDPKLEEVDTSVDKIVPNSTLFLSSSTCAKDLAAQIKRCAENYPTATTRQTASINVLAANSWENTANEIESIDLTLKKQKR